MNKTSRILACTLALSALGGISQPALAEGNISIAQQFGIGYLILDVVRDQRLIEKEGQKEGLDIKVEWRTISGVTGMNEALLSGALDVASAGVPPVLTLWDRTKGKQNVKAIASLGSMPNYLLSNNPAVKSIKDLSEKIGSPYRQQASVFSLVHYKSRPRNYMVTGTSNASIKLASVYRIRTPARH